MTTGRNAVGGTLVARERAQHHVLLASCRIAPVRELVDSHYEKMFQILEGFRRSLFEELERRVMWLLPQPYGYAEFVADRKRELWEGSNLEKALNAELTRDHEVPRP